MDTKRQIWQEWSRKIQQWGFANPVAAFLQAAGPLRIVAAQLAYLGQPLAEPFVRRGSFSVLADILENDADAHAFIALLQQEEET